MIHEDVVDFFDNLMYNGLHILGHKIRRNGHKNFEELMMCLEF